MAALDDLFGVSHDGRLLKQDFFGGSLWVETNQDAAYSYTRYRQLLDTMTCRLQDGFAIAEHKLGTQKVVTVGRGKAVYLNLSPQATFSIARKAPILTRHRQTFLRQINPDGRPPRVVVTHEGAGQPSARPRTGPRGAAPSSSSSRTSP